MHGGGRETSSSLTSTSTTDKLAPSPGNQKELNQRANRPELELEVHQNGRPGRLLPPLHCKGFLNPGGLRDTYRGKALASISVLRPKTTLGSSPTAQRLLPPSLGLQISKFLYHFLSLNSWNYFTHMVLKVCLSWCSSVAYPFPPCLLALAGSFTAHSSALASKCFAALGNSVMNPDINLHALPMFTSALLQSIGKLSQVLISSQTQLLNPHSCKWFY